MDAKKVLLYGKVLAILMVIVSLIIFILWSVLDNGSTSAMSYEIYELTVNSILAYQIVSGVLLVASIVLFMQGNKKVSGLIFVVAAASAMFIMAMMKVMLILIVCILAGIGMRKMKESHMEQDFSSKLDQNDNSFEI